MQLGLQRYLGSAVLLVGLFVGAIDARAQPVGSSEHPGDAYEIRIQRDSQVTQNGSSGSSNNSWSLSERVIAVRDGGLELEFDLPAGASAQERTRSWQFPARVFRPAQGPLVLLNATEVQLRLKASLGEHAQELCGHWVFGWTAERIECDPHSVLEMLEFYVAPAGLRDGAMYSEPGARASAPLRMQERAPGAAVFVAHIEVDADEIRRQRAERDVAVAEMTQRPPLSMEAALNAHVSDQISGTIVTTFETESSGRVTRRTRVTQIDSADQSGNTEREATTETTEWVLSSSAQPH